MTVPGALRQSADGEGLILLGKRRFAQYAGSVGEDGLADGGAGGLVLIPGSVGGDNDGSGLSTGVNRCSAIVTAAQIDNPIAHAMKELTVHLEPPRFIENGTDF